MRIERRAEQHRRPPYAALPFVAIVVSIALAAGWLRLGMPRPVCVFRRWSGLPCPTCGSTRAIEALVSGDIAGAAAWNPLLALALSVAALWALASTVRWACGSPGYRVLLTPLEHRVAWLSVLFLLAAGWLYLIVRGV